MTDGHEATPTSNTKRRFPRRIISIGIYLLLLCADVAFSNWDQFFGQQACGLVTARIWYQRIVTIGYRKPMPHFVQVVTVRPPEKHNPCEYRLVLSNLLRKVGELHPIMVVLDYSFSPHDCPDATSTLQNSINSVAAQAPVVFGVLSYTLQEMKDQHPEELGKIKGFGPQDQAIWFSDIRADGQQVFSGLYRLDCDTRRIPITWPVFEKQDNHWVRDREQKPTIAYLAANLYNPDLKKDPVLKGPENPFSSFIPADRLHPLDFGSILNGSPDALRLRWKIVVIGDGQQDWHDTVVGRIPGVLLQANYIESLLDDRYFRGLSAGVGATCTFICLLVIGLIFDRTTGVNRAAFRATFFLLLLICGSYIALIHFGRLFTFWVPCVAAIPLTYLTTRRPRRT
jgi:hypothetical protein